MAPSQLETGGQKAVQGTVLDAKSRLSALIKAGFSRFNKVPLGTSKYLFIPPIALNSGSPSRVYGMHIYFHVP